MGWYGGAGRTRSAMLLLDPALSGPASGATVVPASPPDEGPAPSTLVPEGCRCRGMMVLTDEVELLGLVSPSPLHLLCPSSMSCSFPSSKAAVCIVSITGGMCPCVPTCRGSGVLAGARPAADPARGGPVLDACAVACPCEAELGLDAMLSRLVVRRTAVATLPLINSATDGRRYGC